MDTFTVEDFVLVVNILAAVSESLSQENKILKKIIKEQQEEIGRIYSADR